MSVTTARLPILTAILFAPVALLAVPVLEAQSSRPSSSKVAWFGGGLTGAQMKAKDEDKLVFIYCWADGSPRSGQFYQETLTSDNGVRKCDDYVCVSAKAQDPDGAKVFAQYNIVTLPTVLIVDGDGKLEDGIIGYITNTGFVNEMERIKSKTNTISDFNKKAGKDKSDLAALYTLAVKYQDLGSQQKYDEIIGTITERDPDGKTMTGAKLKFLELRRRLTTNVQSATDVNLEAVRDFVKTINKKHGEVHWQVWDWIARVEYNKGDREAMRTAMITAGDYVPDDKVMVWGNDVARKAWRMREELTKKEMKSALRIAEKSTDAAEQWVRDGKVQQNSDSFLAQHYYTLACCQTMNNKKKDAVVTLKKCAELDPSQQIYQTRLKNLKGRR